MILGWRITNTSYKMTIFYLPYCENILTFHSSLKVIEYNLSSPSYILRKWWGVSC